MKVVKYCDLAMVFSNFIKLARHSDNIKFFQTSYPYVSRNSLTGEFHHYYNSRRNYEDPHASTTYRQYIGIDNGHYGLYFSIFSHDSKRRQRSTSNTKERRKSAIEVYVPTAREIRNIIDILKTKRDIYNKISDIRRFSKQHLSSMAVLKPKMTVLGRRNFSLVSNGNEVSQEHFNDNVDLMEDQTDDFGSSLLKTQLANMEDICQRGDKVELNLIYPLYQSLKRNSIPLPSASHYNTVLRSIAERQLHNDQLDFESIEARLTTLLTVYQDMLEVASEATKPDAETFQIVLGELFKGSLQTVSIGYGPSYTRYEFEVASLKSKEYAQIGVSIFNSILRLERLDLDKILSNLLVVLNLHPYLLTTELVDKILQVKTTNLSSSGLYYISLIGLSKHLRKMEYFTLTKEHYDFISSVYELYKNATSSHQELLDDEFKVYSGLIQALIDSGNFPLATKFLDDILNDFKTSLIERRISKASKYAISNVLSTYLESILALGEKDNILKAYNLLMKFNEFSYLPELSTNLYNNMINQFNNLYHCLEIEKRAKRCNPDKFNELSSLQKSYYEIMWKLYNHLAIRRDYQNPPMIQDFTDLVLHDKVFNCREYLLSLSIDLGDHENVFQLIKEIMLKNHLVLDLNIFKKVTTYLFQGSFVNGFNEYYFSLLTALIEYQSAHYERNPRILHNFLSEFCEFITVRNIEGLHFILNSLMVEKAFSSLDLREDNVYGIFKVAKYMTEQSLSNLEVLSQKDLSRLLHLSSMLINEFENPDSHYVELNEEFKAFAHELKKTFKTLFERYAMHSDMSSMPEIARACAICGIEAETNESSSGVGSNYYGDVRLVPLLNVNYNVGIEKFLELFDKDYKFDISTWKIVLNYNFIHDILEKDTVLSIEDLIDRIFALNFDSKEKIDLIVTLINTGSEKIAIRVLKSISHSPLLTTSPVLLSIMRVSIASPNIYLHKLLNDKFSIIVKSNDSKECLEMYLRFLLKSNTFRQMEGIVLPHASTRYFDLNEKVDINILCSALEIYAKLQKFDAFNELFKKSISHFDAKKIIGKSSELKSLLIRYYTLNGCFTLIDDLFGNLRDTAEFRGLLGFNSFMMQMRDGKHDVKLQEYHQLEEFTLQLMMCDELLQMINLYKINRGYKKNAIFGSAVCHLTRAAGINLFLGQPSTQAFSKFNALLKFMRYAKFNTMTVENLLQVIDFLAVIGQKNQLNVLLTKLLDGKSLSKLINYYFYEIPLLTDKDRVSVLSKLNDSFTYLGDEINIFAINEIVKANKLKLPSADTNSHLLDLILK